MLVYNRKPFFDSKHLYVELHGDSVLNTFTSVFPLLLDVNLA